SRKRDAVSRETERLKSVWINPKTLSHHVAEELLGKQLEKEASLHDLLKRPQVSYQALMSLINTDGDLVAGPGLDDPSAAEQVEIQIKYAGYVAKQQEEIQRQQDQESQVIPEDIDYDQITSLSIE